MRDTAIIYRSFYESIKQLPIEDQAIIWAAICELSFNFNEVELTGINSVIFGLIKPIIEANNKRFENGKQPKYKQNGSKTEAKQKQTVSKVEGNKDKDKDIDKDIDKDKEIRIEDVIQYFKEKGYTEESARKAHEYYACNEWKDSNGKKVRNWKQKMNSVWFKPENKDNTPKLTIPKEENVW